MKTTLNTHSRKDLRWSWSCNTLATWCEELTNQKRHWHWERLKAKAEDEMVRLHHQLNGHESEQTLGDSEGETSLVCFSLQGPKKSDTKGYMLYDSIYMKWPDQANPRDRKEIGEFQGQWGEEMGSRILWEWGLFSQQLWVSLCHDQMFWN